ncbi:MAG TPA: hexose kinase [Candidatus Limnocylindrales bacterium]
MVDPGRPRLVFIAANPSIDRLYEVDRLTNGAIHRPTVVVARPGGKGLNAARAAAALGARTTAVGIVGGRSGDWIVERLLEIGIDALMTRSAGETRTCVSILDHATGSLTELYERGEGIEPAAWVALEALVARELDRGDVGALAFSGSLPPGAPTDGYARIARIAAARSVAILADTYGPALDEVLAELPAVVKVNAAEAGDAAGLAVGDAASAVAAARILRDRGAVGVVVTLGLAGAIAVGATGEARLVPPDVRGAYPVGSGDAFLAGLATALVGGSPLIDAARLGMAAGIANALLPGAGELDRTTAKRLVGLVVVTPL